MGVTQETEVAMETASHGGLRGVDSKACPLWSLFFPRSPDERRPAFFSIEFSPPERSLPVPRFAGKHVYFVHNPPSASTCSDANLSVYNSCHISNRKPNVLSSAFRGAILLLLISSVYYVSLNILNLSLTLCVKHFFYKFTLYFNGSIGSKLYLHSVWFHSNNKRQDHYYLKLLPITIAPSRLQWHLWKSPLIKILDRYWEYHIETSHSEYMHVNRLYNISVYETPKANRDLYLTSITEWAQSCLTLRPLFLVDEIKATRWVCPDLDMLASYGIQRPLRLFDAARA